MKCHVTWFSVAVQCWEVSIVLSKDEPDHRVWATGETGGQVCHIT